ncbi:Cell cycle protein, partial [gut metagenome]
MALLMVIGCVNVFSASYIVAQYENFSSYHYLGRYIIYAVLGMGCIYMVRKIGYRWFMHPRNVMLAYFASVVLVLLVYAVGVEANGAKRWLHLGFITFQPSELAKVVAIMMTALALSHSIRVGKTVSLL